MPQSIGIFFHWLLLSSISNHFCLWRLTDQSNIGISVLIKLRSCCSFSCTWCAAVPGCNASQPELTPQLEAVLQTLTSFHVNSSLVFNSFLFGSELGSLLDLRSFSYKNHLWKLSWAVPLQVRWLCCLIKYCVLKWSGISKGHAWTDLLC